MKSLLAIGTTLGLVLATSVSSAALIQYKATLNGKQEVPANASAATGTATLTFDNVTKKIYGTITFTGVTPTNNGYHIHRGACGVGNGTVVDGPLPDPVANTITIPQNGGNSITLNAADETALAAAGLYVNIHSAANPGGEIRGQIYPMASTTTCPAGGTDGGAEGGTDGGSSGTSGTSGTSGGTSGTSGGTSGNTSGSNGATTDRPDGGEEAAPTEDSGGCSTTGSDSSNGLAFAGLAIVGVAIANRLRNRKRD